MTIFQFLLLLLTLSIFYSFFRQLFSGDYPKRGVDFEAKREDEQIGSISNIGKSFQRPVVRPSRFEELISLADEAIEKKDFDEAKKALQSALIVEKNNTETLGKYGFVLIQLKEYEEAKDVYEDIIKIDKDDDMAYAILANCYNKLSLKTQAITYHKISIKLDDEYAPHYFNYANTLYDMKNLEEALSMYKKAYKLDNSLDEAKKMIEMLS